MTKPCILAIVSLFVFGCSSAEQPKPRCLLTAEWHDVGDSTECLKGIDNSCRSRTFGCRDRKETSDGPA